MANCNRCGKSLKRIAYIEPDWEGHQLYCPRPPLCKDCWIKADGEERARTAAKREEAPHA